jgi:membrane protein DedA with SNARE-associated domain
VTWTLAAIVGADAKPDPSLLQMISLWILPFAHEDLAIILGAYYFISGLMPAVMVAASIYGGMVASDFLLYGVGFCARYIPWLSRFAVSDRVRRFGEVFSRDLFGLFALCRIVPGAAFVTFIACGWMRISIIRFAMASFLVSALYLVLMLYLVIVFGAVMAERIGLWAWPLLAVAVLVFGHVRRRVLAFQRIAHDDETLSISGGRGDVRTLPPGLGRADVLGSGVQPKPAARAD